MPPNENLNELEQRLSSWLPSTGGLETERMLFAAGRASAQATRGKFLWPGISSGLALLAIFFGARWEFERTERLALVQQLQYQTPAVARGLAIEAPLSEPPPKDAPAPNAYLAVRRQLEKNPDFLLAHTFSKAEVPQNAVSPDPPVLKVGQLGGLLDR
jgi:hypothetical protein